MTKKNLNFLLQFSASCVVSVLLSIFLYRELSHYFESYQSLPDIKNEFTNESNYSFFIHCLLYVFSLLSLPFINAHFYRFFVKSKRNLFRTLLITELINFLCIRLFTPPNYLGSFYYLMIWQLPIFTNFIVLLKQLNRSNLS